MDIFGSTNQHGCSFKAQTINTQWVTAPRLHPSFFIQSLGLIYHRCSSEGTTCWCVVKFIDMKSVSIVSANE